MSLHGRPRYFLSKSVDAVMDIEPIDRISFWGYFLLVAVISMIAVEAGFRFGKWRHARRKDEKESPVAAMVASVLGLLAFMLAFTFGLAASRFDARRQAVLEEANSIGTTYLRTQLLPEPHRTESAKLLREYTKLRTQGFNHGNIHGIMERSDELHQALWKHAIEAAEKDPHSITTGLFLQSLNETIDLHAKRLFVGLRSRVPMTIWLTLWSLTFIGMFSVGYQTGLSGTRRSPEMPILSFAFAVVLLLIVDLDRAHEGFLQVSQESMKEVLNSMQRNSP
jgi:hypothetical protein